MRALLLLLGFATGCASISSVQSADTLGRGNLQGAIEPGLWGGTSSRSGVQVIPHVDGAVRFGVTDRVDLGVRAGMSFLELQTKFLLTEPGNPRLAMSLAPTVGGIFSSGGGNTQEGIFNAAVPLLIGVKFAGGHQLILGPRAQGFLIVANGSLTPIVAVGSSVGFLWQVGDNFGLLPEVAVLVPVVGAATTSQLLFQGLNTGAAFVQFKLGLMFGRARGVGAQRAPGPVSPPPAPPLPAPESVEPPPSL
jgi:hypothetical protein